MGSKLEVDYYLPHLPDLIGFGVTSLRLQIQDLFDPIMSEDMVTATNPLVKAKRSKQRPQPIERDVRVGCSAEDLIK
jgi:hypothetical protein